MSGLGRYQQILDKQGIEESMSYSLFRFLFGDITESIIMLIMKEAGVTSLTTIHLSNDLDGIVIKGTLMSSYATRVVWRRCGISSLPVTRTSLSSLVTRATRVSRRTVVTCMQKLLYSEAVGMPFGGWIVVNKSSGEVAVVEVPDWCQEDKKKPSQKPSGVSNF